MESISVVQVVEAEGEQSSNSEPFSLKDYLLPQISIHKLRVDGAEIGRIAKEKGVGALKALAIWIDQLVMCHNAARGESQSKMQFQASSREGHPWWHSHLYHDFRIKIYYSIVSSANVIGRLLARVGEEGNFHPQQDHFIIFFYRELIKTTKVAEGQFVETNDYEVFALTKGQAWQALKNRDFQFPIKVIKRIGSSRNITMVSSRNLTGPALFSSYLFYQKDVCAALSEYLYQVIVRISVLLRSSAYIRSQYPLVTKKGPTSARITVKMGVGSIKIGRQMSLPGYAFILDYISKVCLGELSPCLDSATEKEVDDPGFDFLDLVHPVEYAHVHILEEYRKELIWRMFQGEQETGLYLCHKYVAEFFSSDLRFIFKKRDLDCWSYPPPLEEVFPLLRSVLKAANKEDFFEAFKHFRISYSKGSFPFLDCVEGEVRTREGKAYFYLSGVWQQTSVEYHVILQRDFNALLQEHLASRDSPAHLPRPWMFHAEWASFSLEDVQAKVSNPELAAAQLTYLLQSKLESGKSYCELVKGKRDRYLMNTPMNYEGVETISKADREALQNFLNQRYSLNKAAQKEGPYNESYLYDQSNGGNFYGPKEGYIVGDRITQTARNLEIFDVLRYTEDACYLFHVKEGFGASTRVACGQIRESAKEFQQLRNAHSSSDVVEEFWSEVISSKKDGYHQKLKAQLEHLGKAQFKAIFQRKKMVFVFAFIDSEGEKERLLENEGKLAREVQFSIDDFLRADCLTYNKKRVVTHEQIFQLLEEEGYLCGGKVTDKFLVCSKKKFWQDKKLPRAAIYDVIINKLAPFLSQYDSTVAKIELLTVRDELQKMGFDFKICQIRRPEGAVGRGAEEKELLSLPQYTTAVDDNVVWAPNRTFSFEGVNYSRKETRGNGSCALHAVLGKNQNGTYLYPRGQYPDSQAKVDFLIHMSISQDQVIGNLYIQNIYALYDEAFSLSSSPMRKELLQPMFVNIGNYQQWQEADRALTNDIKRLKLEEGAIWKELTFVYEQIRQRLSQQIDHDTPAERFVNWVGEDRDHLEVLLPQDPSNELLQRRIRLRDEIAAKSTKRDQGKFDFLRQPDVLDRYKEVFFNARYFLNSIEIQMTAILYNKRVTIVHYMPNGEIGRSAEDFNPESPDHVHVFHEGEHFERCEPAL